MLRWCIRICTGRENTELEHLYFLGWVKIFRVTKPSCGQHFSAYKHDMHASVTFPAVSALQEMPGRQWLAACTARSSKLHGHTSAFPSPANTAPKRHRLEKNTKRWLNENPAHNESSYSDLDWQGRTAPPLLRSKINHANQSSHSREPFPPLGSVSKHNTVATVILMVNTTNQVNRTDIYLFYFFSPESDSCLRLITRSIHWASAWANSGANTPQ